MNFNLTKEQEMVRTITRKFAEEVVQPLAAEVDEMEKFPRGTVDQMARYGMLGIPFPKAYNGSNGDNVSYAITVEELSKACATTGVIVSAHTSLGAHPIYQFGSEEQKQEFLAPLACGEKLGGFGLTEPNAGTDAAGQQTVAVLDGDKWILNGTKVFITNGGEAQTYIIFAMTDKSKGTRGISAFIVPDDSPGFSIGAIEHKMGIRGSSTSELIMEDCVIPKENILGDPGDGFKIAMQTLDGGRIGIASQALGIAQGAMDETIKYMKDRKQFGQSLSKFQGLQWMIADMEVQIASARHLVYNAAWRKDNKLSYSKESAMAKLVAANTAMDVTTKAVQLHGGYGYIREYPIERMMRDAKITEIYEGTSQVQKMVIAASLFK